MKHCLVVDDSRIIRKIACSILKSLNFDTREAADGAAALAACRASMPDVILLDLQMPSTSSTDFVRILRRQAHGEHPYVLLCTTENDVPRLTEAFQAGANHYLMKPFDRESLAEKLEQTGAV